MMKLRLPVYFLAIALLLVSCKKKDDANALFNSFDRKAMLTNQANTSITPALTDLLLSSDSLYTATANFNTHPNAVSFAAVQTYWLSIALNIKRLELYDFGPINENLIYRTFDFWPARPSDVESFIASHATFNNSLIESSGTAVKGAPVIEYLLFNSNAYVSFTTDVDATKRREYLLALSANLVQKSQLVKDTWANGYAETYKTKDAQAIDGSINITINRLIELVEFIKNTKVGKPFGKKDGVKYPDQVEAFHSGYSIFFIKSNLLEMQGLFSGKGGIGYDDFLVHMNAKTDAGDNLAQKIDQQFTVCIAKCDAIQTPLSSAVNSQQQAVDDLYLALKELIVYLKVDMVNSLGITLTFTDNDGD